jgi:hypothetical protein
LGALAHYAADTGGHPGVNLSVALTYPDLKSAFCHEVTYEQDTRAHLKVEFGFDMYQVVTNRYAQQEYHERLGFRVAQDLLERSLAPRSPRGMSRLSATNTPTELPRRGHFFAAQSAKKPII